MKRLQYIAVILAFMPLTVSAQKHVINKFLVTADAGGSTYIGTMPQASPSWGGGGSLGLGYELQKSNFLFQTGIGARFTQVGLRINDGRYVLYDQYDSQNYRFNYIYEENRRSDKYNNISMMVPVLFGARFNYVYFLLGAKAQFALYRGSKSTGYYTTSGEYIELIDIFEDMPNHKFFVDRPRDASSVDKSTLAAFNVAVSGEIGGEFPIGSYSKHNASLRVAAFADFTVMDVHKTGRDRLLVLPSSFDPLAPGETMIDNIVIMDYMHSNACPSAIRQLMVGVKLTFLLSGKAKPACVICDGNYPTNNRNNQRRGTRIFADW